MGNGEFIRLVDDTLTNRRKEIPRKKRITSGGENYGKLNFSQSDFDFFLPHKLYVSTKYK